MNQRDAFLQHQSLPVFLEQADLLREFLRGLTLEQLQKLLCCNRQIAESNYIRYQQMVLRRNLSPAILSFEGIQYRYMAPQVFTYDAFDYIDRHLCILSGLYGLLRPFDGVVPYRLEMQAKLRASFCSSLYEFWGDKLYRQLAETDTVFINLASAEYSKVISRYLAPHIRFITCTFGELEAGKIREKGVYVKMARGEMVRYMAERGVKTPEEMQQFNHLGYAFAQSLSSETNYVFLRRA